MSEAAERWRDWLMPPDKGPRYFVFDPVRKELVEVTRLRGWKP